MLRILLSTQLFVFVLGRVHVPTKEIAPGVHMPVMSIGVGGLHSDKAYTIVSDWLKLGGRGIDCATMYGNHAEVAKAIADVGVDRQDLFITSKIPGCVFPQAAVWQILAELKVSYIDLLLVHFPLGDCAGAWSVLEDFHAQGVLKSIGVSDFQPAQLMPILKIAKIKPAVHQIKFSIAEHDDDTVKFTNAYGITIESWSPLRVSAWNGHVSDDEALQTIAAHHNVSTSQIALRWVIQHGHVLTFQSRSKEHQADDADIFNFTLTDDDMSLLDQQSATSLQLRRFTDGEQVFM